MIFSIPQRNIYFSFFIYSFCLGVFFPRIGDLQNQMGIGETTLGLTLLGPAIGVQISLLFADKIFSLLGFRLVMCLGVPILGLALVCSSLTFKPFIFFISLMLGGFAIGILEVAVNLEADRIEYKISKKIMNRSHSFWSLGFFCSGLTGALFSQMKVSPFVNFSLSLFLGTFLTILFCSKYIPADERPNSSVNNSLFVKPTKAVLALVVLTLSPMLLESASIDWSVIYMRDIFFTPPFINGLAIVMVALTQFSVRYYADQYVEIYGSEKVSKISVVAMLIGVISVCFSNSPYLSLVGFAFIGGGSAVIFPLAMSAAAQKTDRPAAINVASLAQISFLVFLLAPPILGFIAENFGIRISFGIGLPLVIVSWFFISSLKSK
jgi:MFS family permease